MQCSWQPRQAGKLSMLRDNNKKPCETGTRARYTINTYIQANRQTDWQPRQHNCTVKCSDTHRLYFSVSNRFTLSFTQTERHTGLYTSTCAHTGIHTNKLFSHYHTHTNSTQAYKSARHIQALSFCFTRLHTSSDVGTGMITAVSYCLTSLCSPPISTAHGLLITGPCFRRPHLVGHVTTSFQGSW